jgi:hypothetical protein
MRKAKKGGVCNLTVEFVRLLNMGTLLRAISKVADSIDGVADRHMRRLLQGIPILLIVVGALLLFEQPAYAYTDPGTGLLAIQAAGSALIAAGWYLRRKIYALLHRGAATKQQPEYPVGQEDESSSHT